MPITVGKLIRKLTKFPMEAKVAAFDWRDVEFPLSNVEGIMEIDGDGPIDLVKLNFSEVERKE